MHWENPLLLHHAATQCGKYKNLLLFEIISWNQFEKKKLISWTFYDVSVRVKSRNFHTKVVWKLWNFAETILNKKKSVNLIVLVIRNSTLNWFDGKTCMAVNFCISKLEKKPIIWKIFREIILQFDNEKVVFTKF